MNKRLTDALEPSTRVLAEKSDDISIEDIMSHYYSFDGKECVFGPGALNDGCGCLGELARRLRAQCQFVVVLVNQQFFTKRKPENEEEARLRLALGGGKRAFGLHIVREKPEEDLIFLAQMHWSLNQNGGRGKNAFDQIKEAVRQNAISPKTACDLLRGFLAKATDTEKPNLEGALKELERLLIIAPK